MKNFTLAAVVALFSLAVSAAVVEPFAFFSFTNGTAGASAVGVITNEINPGVNDMTIQTASIAGFDPTFEENVPGRFLFGNGYSGSDPMPLTPRSVHLHSSNSAGKAGNMTIAKAATAFSECHGSGYTFEMFYCILPTETWAKSSTTHIFGCDAGYSISGLTKQFRIYFTSDTMMRYGINGYSSGYASGSVEIPKLNDGRWHHFAVVETKSAHLEIWIDYVRYVDVEIPSSVVLTTSSNKHVEFARQNLQGRFTCFRLTKAALTGSEFLYAASRMKLDMSVQTLAFYPFDDAVSGSEALSVSACNAAYPTLCPGVMSLADPATSKLTFDSDAPGRYIFSGRSYGAEKIYENPASICMTNSMRGTSASVDFRGLSTELSKSHSTGSTIEYFVKVEDDNMKPLLPVLISDAGYVHGSTDEKLNLYIPYDGEKQISYALGDFGAGGLSFSGMHPHGFVTNGWHHVAVVEKDKKIRLYVDYVQYGEIAVTSTKVLDSAGGTIPANVRHLVLGNYLQHCKISCVRVMKRALDPSEFMWASNLPTCVQPTVFQWTLDNTTPSQISNVVSTFASANPDLYVSKVSTFTGTGTPSTDPAPTVGLTGKGRYAHCDVIRGEDPRRENKCCMYFDSPDAAPTASSYRGGSDIRIATGNSTELNDAGPFTAEGFFKFDRNAWTNSLSQQSKPPKDKVVLMSRVATNDEPRVVWSVSLINASTPETTLLQLTSSWGPDDSTTQDSVEGKFGDGKWHHVAVTYDPVLKKMYAYFDYQLVVENALDGALDIGTAGRISFGNGNEAGGNNFMGWVDEFRYSCVQFQPSQFLVQENHRGASLLFH